ncbi:hypothetical protein G9F72_019250 [Clostridium estertheticum]|uniref:hypothetical protein n=1 Tax=Clostridium estertheticum TaxID=238834 RepID=UPI0013E95808|nr:hypothetical protein [Clostridium estertheticum]MBZ9688470.1 hypothetical protein [Clostridium estertheticum]
MQIYLAKIINKHSSEVEVEAVFDTLDKAISWIRAIDLSEITSNSNYDIADINNTYCFNTTAYDFQVLSKDLNSGEIGKNSEYLFSADGDLLYSYDSISNQVFEVDLAEFGSTDDDTDAGRKFNRGDIVLLIGETHGGYKRACDYIGVIGALPTPKKDWLWPEPWQNTYFIYFISEKGLIDRSKVQERYIQFLNLKLPFELSFLVILSKVIKGELVISDEVRDELFYGDMFVRTVKYYKEINGLNEVQL